MSDREQLAEAWEAGYGAGRDDEAQGFSHRGLERSPNPYTETVIHDEDRKALQTLTEWATRTGEWSEPA